MDKLKQIETEITPKERTEDGTTTQGLKSEGARASDAVSLRSKTATTEGAGESFGDAMAFGTVDNEPAVRGEQSVAAQIGRAHV